MQVTATEAKNRFGQVCAQAKREPIFVEKAGRVDSVILSLQQYEEILAQAQPSIQTQAAGKAFYSKYKDWVDMQNALVDAHGTPGEEFRPW
jgi:PHD/YefM family antitoxin component YafN of YafNO toxin-antitoxin module